MKDFVLEVWGQYACFTRPEMKVERVSYDVITPSAARGVFSAILKKPAMQWNINKIEVLNPIRFVSIRRNEVKDRATSFRKPIVIEDCRTQRNTMMLKDVRYRLHATFELTDCADSDDNAVKFMEMFRRRARKGQCIYQPYLGCREFMAFFRLVEDTEALQPAIQETRDLNWMLYDIVFANDDSTNPKDKKRKKKGAGPQNHPRFFKAKMVNGVIDVKNSEISQ